MSDPTSQRALVGQEQGPRSRQSQRERPLVLVVDDDAITLEATRERLERLGCDVTTRDQSLGTSRWIIENKPDLVLLDLMMPALTGVELARLLRRNGTAGVVVHSSQSPQEMARVAKEVGALGGLSKALSDAEFAREVTRFIRLSRAETEGTP